jgi:hypothetical protein
MAISLIAKPQLFSPTYNPLKFIYDSTNKNEDGFRYVFDIYLSGTGTRIARYKVSPRFSDGYGEKDIAKLIETQVQNKFSRPDKSETAAEYFYKYDVKIGEEFVTSVAYTSSLTNDGGLVEITATHTFQVGDQVVITQADGGVANPNLEGLFTVTAIDTTVSFTVNSLWANVTDATIDGSVKYADNRKTLTPNLQTDADNYGYNAAFSFVDWSGYNQALWRMTTNNTHRFLTNMPPRPFVITPNQGLYMMMCSNGTTTGRIYFLNDGGDEMYYAANANSYVFRAGIGADATPNVLVSGTLGHIKSDTKYYDVWYANSSGQRRSSLYRIEIDRRCTINDTILYFVDRKGSIGSFAFQLRQYERGTVAKENFNRDITGTVGGSIWSYGTEEFGGNTFNIELGRTYELNTNWMTEDMARYFEELVSSPVVYLLQNNVYQKVDIVDTSFEVEKAKNKNLIRKTITITPSNKDVVNG